MNSFYINTKLWIGIWCGLIFTLELLAPVQYVFGYLYIVPILLAACELSSHATSISNRLTATLTVTKIGIALTLFNLIISEAKYLNTLSFRNLSIDNVVNRLTLIIVLLLTNWLIDRNLKYVDEIYRKKEEINKHKAELLVQMRLDRLHQDFVYTLTHDLKTPLLGAIQTIKYFQQEKFGAVSLTQSDVLGKMSRSHQRSLQLVETLLDIYRHDTEGLVLHREPLDLRSIAKEAIDSVVILGLERQIDINLSSDESPDFQPQPSGDRLQLSRVFTNLLSNAIYHSPSGGQVEIAIADRDRQYIVKVSDRGKGIDPAELPLLFDRFYQARKQLKGSGLGLYLSRQIVEAHGGKIWAEPICPHGANFCFSLPIDP